jgi:hypothetical protein
MKTFSAALAEWAKRSVPIINGSMGTSRASLPILRHQD